MNIDLEALERLSRLRDAGTLTEEEFQDQKSHIMSQQPSMTNDREDREHHRRPRGFRNLIPGKSPALFGFGLFIVIGGLFGWWWASPYMTLRGMQTAIAERNVDSLSRFIDFASLRENLKSRYFNEVSKKAGSSSDGSQSDLSLLEGAMIGPVVDSFVSKEGLRLLLSMKKPDGRGFGLTTPPAKDAEVVRTGLLEFRVKNVDGGSFIFRQKGLGWALSDVEDSPRRATARSSAATKNSESDNVLSGLTGGTSGGYGETLEEYQKRMNPVAPAERIDEGATPDTTANDNDDFFDITTLGGGSPYVGWCLLEVGGRKLIDGECDYELEATGSFRVHETKSNQFAAVVRGHDVAQAYWNGPARLATGNVPLGDVMRDGACWHTLGEDKICLWGEGKKGRLYVGSGE